MKKLFLVFLLTLVGCTDAAVGKLQSFGGKGKVQCWSGTLQIFNGESTGKISNSSQSDGYYFVDETTGKLTEVSGNCVIVYESY